MVSSAQGYQVHGKRKGSRLANGQSGITGFQSSPGFQGCNVTGQSSKLAPWSQGCRCRRLAQLAPMGNYRLTAIHFKSGVTKLRLLAHFSPTFATGWITGLRVVLGLIQDWRVPRFDGFRVPRFQDSSIYRFRFFRALLWGCADTRSSPAN